MPSFQIATCQTGRIATGIMQYNSYEATLLRAALFAILLYFMGGLVKHDLKRKGESGYAIIFFLTLYQQPKRTSLHTFPTTGRGGPHFTLFPTDFIHVSIIDRTVLRTFLLVLL